MSTASHSPSPVELEPVTCWPLIIAAVSFVGVGVLFVVGFAAWSALFPPPRPEVAVEVPAPPAAASADREPIDLPAALAARSDNERVVKIHREVIQRYTPLPRPQRKEADPAASPSPPSLAVAARGPAVPVAPTYLKAMQPPPDAWLLNLRKVEVDRKPLGFHSTGEAWGTGTFDANKPFPLTRALPRSAEEPQRTAGRSRAGRAELNV